VIVAAGHGDVLDRAMLALALALEAHASVLWCPLDDLATGAGEVRRGGTVRWGRSSIWHTHATAVSCVPLQVEAAEEEECRALTERRATAEVPWSGMVPE